MAGSTLSAKQWKNPSRPSRISAGPVMPSRASMAERIPFRAALPGWICFETDPSISYWLIPEARLPASPKAFTVCSSERPRIFAAAAVVPKDAMVPVG